MNIIQQIDTLEESLDAADPHLTPAALSQKRKALAHLRYLRGYLKSLPPALIDAAIPSTRPASETLPVSAIQSGHGHVV